VVTKGYLESLIEGSASISQVLHFDPSSRILTAQDPQFVFYIRNLSWPQFAEEVGYLSVDFPARYDFALSFAGSDRDIAESLFSALQECEFEVFYDKNEQHRLLAEDIEEYLAPIYNSDAQLVICILGPDYPKRIWTEVRIGPIQGALQERRSDTNHLLQRGIGDVRRSAAGGHIKWDREADSAPRFRRLSKFCARK